MNNTFFRAVGCVGLCASLSGCAGTFGKGGLAGIIVESVFAVAVAAINGSTHDHARAPAPVPAARTPIYADQEDPAMLTCDAKRREFLSVYGGVRRLPPQLVCSPEGEFGAPEVYGSSSASRTSAELADGTL